MSQQFIIAGLGNPGSKYSGTRHNIGFRFIDELVFEQNLSYKSEQQGMVAKGNKGFYVKPMTFMNLSGQCIGGLMRYYKIPLENVIVIHDELDFDPGTVRVKSGGGHGGNNGLRSIIEHCNNGFNRIRIGIGKPKYQGAEHVLGKFNKAEIPLIDDALITAHQALDLILNKGVKEAQQIIHAQN